MREQRQSDLIKKGEGKSHEAAKTRLVNILIDNGYEVFPDAKFGCSWAFTSQNETALLKIPSTGESVGTNAYYHEFDIYAKKDNDNGLTSELCIEIDGKSHNSKVQQGKDKTASRYANFFLPDARFIRIDIATLSKAWTDDQILGFLKLIKIK